MMEDYAEQGGKDGRLGGFGRYNAAPPQRQVAEVVEF